MFGQHRRFWKFAGQIILSVALIFVGWSIGVHGEAGALSSPKWSYNDEITIILTALGVILTAIAIFIALLAIWGYSGMKDEVRRNVDTWLSEKIVAHLMNSPTFKRGIAEEVSRITPDEDPERSLPAALIEDDKP